MSLRASIQQGVDEAFIAIDDIAKMVTFIRKTDAGFDFSSREKVDPESCYVVCKCYVRDTEDNSEVIKKRLMLKTIDIGDITAFDSVEIDGIKYRLGPNPRDDSFVVYVDVYNG